MAHMIKKRELIESCIGNRHGNMEPSPSFNYFIVISKNNNSHSLQHEMDEHRTKIYPK